MTIQDAKRAYVTDVATELILKKPLASVTIRDIAAASGVGEATVYRYYSTRSNLIVAVALKLQAEVGARFLDFAQGSDAYEKLSRFYGAYLKLFRVRPELYRFLSEFDAYCINSGEAELSEYQDNFDRFRETVLDIYRQGVADGTVRPHEDFELFYYATTHALLSLCKKLATERHVVRQDATFDAGEEIRTLTELILAALKN